MAEYGKLDSGLRVYLEKITTNLERHVCDNLEVPAPPSLARFHWERERERSESASALERQGASTSSGQLQWERGRRVLRQEAKRSRVLV